MIERKMEQPQHPEVLPLNQKPPEDSAEDTLRRRNERITKLRKNLGKMKDHRRLKSDDLSLPGRRSSYTVTASNIPSLPASSGVDGGRNSYPHALFRSLRPASFDSTSSHASAVNDTYDSMTSYRRYLGDELPSKGASPTSEGDGDVAGAFGRRLRKEGLASSVSQGLDQRKRWSDHLKDSWEVFMWRISEKLPLLQRQAAEACRWLRSAGFPQYAHLYEGGGFPLDVDDVNVDHDFLNKDQLAAIVRRLNILNKCASMKLDRTTQPSSKHFVSSSTNITETDDDDEEECAISNVWKLDVDSANEAGRWSRLNSAATSTPHDDDSSGGSLTSPGSDVPSQFTTGSEDVFALAMSDNQLSVKLDDYKSNFSATVSSKPPSVAGGDKKNKFNKSHSFLKKVGSDLRKLRSGSFRRKDGKEAFKKSSLVIGDPILTAGLDRVNQMRCVAIEGSAPEDAERKSSSNSLISSSSSGGASSSGLFKQLSSDHADPFLFHPSHTTSAKPRAFSSDNVFLTPSNHIPGTFPISIREPSDSAAAAAATSATETPRSAMTSSLSSSSSSSTSSSTRHDSESSSAGETGGESSMMLKPHGNLIRPLSIYDNLSNDDGATTEELLEILQSPTPHLMSEAMMNAHSLFGSRERLGGGSDHKKNGSSKRADLLWGYDDIVNASNHLQHMVQSWEEDLEVNDDVTATGSEQKQQLFLLPTANYKPTLPSYNQNAAKSLKDGKDSRTEDSGDGGSKKQRSDFCWKNFKTDHLRNNSASNVDSTSGHLTKLTYIHELSVGQLMMLRRLSLLKLTAHMESYAMPNNKNSSWSMPRFIRKVKNPEYKDKSVFGIPLLYNVRKTGQPIPPCILQALAYLRRSALTQKGLFRKPGVRSRIAKLRCGCETNGKFAFYDDCSPYDVADMVKQYFRELPDPLMTSKMNDTFVGIFMHVPEHLRLPALQAAVMLLPDENREALMTLLCFLSDVTAEREENQMTSSNLATCFAPSLFCFQPSRASQNTVSPKTRKQQSSKSANHNFAARMVDQKERDENVIANKCISFMIENVNHLFVLPEDTMTQCRISVMQQIDDVLAAEIGYSTPEVIDAGAGSGDFLSEFHSYVDRMVAQGVRDEQRTTQSRSNGWQNTLSPSGCELTCKKVNDGNPLRLWKCKVEGVKATVKQAMERILHERQIWDDDLSEWKVIQQPEENTQLFQIVTSEMPPHPSRDFCLLRSWRNDITPSGGSAIVEVSAGQNVPLLGDVRGVMLTSRYLIEPSASSPADECSITRVCRVDLKGRNPEWYNKTYGHIVARQLFRIHESFSAAVTTTTTAS